MLTAGRDIDEMQASLMRTLASGHRLRIVHLLGGRPWDVTELANELGLSQAATSQHLAALRAAGIVEADREGRAMHYRLTDAEILAACDRMRAVLVRRLSRLGDIASSAGRPTRLGHLSDQVGRQ